MTDQRVVIMSTQGYQQLVKPENGKNLHWTTDVNSELPIKLTTQGDGAQRPITMINLFQNAVQAGGDRTSMLVERKGKVITWSWKQFWNDSFSFAKALAKLEVRERSAVAVMGFNSPEWVIGFLGGMIANCVSTGIYSTNAPEACHYQADHSEAEVILVENNELLKRFTSGLSKLPKVKAIVVWGEEALPSDVQDSRFFLWRDFLKLGSEINDDVVNEKIEKQKPGQACCLIYTSGTTGNPKGCMLSHDNLVWAGVQVAETQDNSKPGVMGPHNRIVSYLPLSHIAGLCFDVLNHLFNCCEIYFAKPDALQGTLGETLTWARPTLFLAVPRIWEKFEEKLKEIAATKPSILQSISGWAKGYGTANTHARQKHEDPPLMYSLANTLILSTIKKALGLDQSQLFFFGAAPLKKTSVDYFASLDMPLLNVYGMSETTGATTLQTDSNFRLDSAGFAVPGTTLKIDNPDENGEGEICMRGRHIMMGYLKNDQATIDTIDSQGFLHSGDRGKIEKDGHLKITGRIKEIIITAGGENVAPVPIEDAFKTFCPPCSNIMLLGEQQRFMAALITFKVDIDLKTGSPSKNLLPDTIAFFKNELGVDLQTSDQAATDPKVNEFIKKAVEATNKKSVSRASHIRKFTILTEDFSIPGGELTPTLKLKRKVTEKKYQKEVDALFVMEAKL